MYLSEKEFYLTIVRHGQTIANVLKNIQGHSNTSLTELGIEQAKSFGRYFNKNVHNQFDRVYSSDLDRAYETCKIIIDACCNSEMTIKKEARLRERKYGPLFEGKPIARLLMEAYGLGFNETNFTQYTPEGVESMEELKQRVKEFCDDTLLKDCQQGEEVLIVSHWATIKEFLKLFQPNANESIKQEHLLETPNAAFCRFKLFCKFIEPSHEANMTSEQSEKYILDVKVISLHQTPHFSLKQISVNMKQELE